MLIDSHCHLHDRQFFSAEQAEEMLKRAKYNTVEKVICIGTDPEDSMKAKEFAESHENIYWTFGVHPSEWNKWNSLDNKKDFLKNIFVASSREYRTVSDAALGEATKNIPDENLPIQEIPFAPLVAIGEVGLDYHYGSEDREEQIKLFRDMLDLAREYNLPVSFHIREAFADFFEIIADYPDIRGVVHSFSDNKKNLKRILEQTNLYVGVNGMATYSTLPMPPLERILLETDAPFLTPAPFRGIINEPGYVLNIAQWLAEKLSQNYEIIEKETTKNARQLFNI